MSRISFLATLFNRYRRMPLYNIKFVAQCKRSLPIIIVYLGGLGGNVDMVNVVFSYKVMKLDNLTYHFGRSHV